jgi:hypothetical protein
MNDELKFNDESLRQIQELINTPAFNIVRRQAEVRNWRNETQADWVTNFMQRMHQQTNEELDAATGEAHTVESKVQELRQRVRLDAIEKQASAEQIPLSKQMILEAKSKKKDLSGSDTKQQIQRFIEDHYSSHRGYADEPAVIYACREKFGDDRVADNISFIKKMIDEARSRYLTPDIGATLPSPFQGQPMKADPQGDTFQPLFENIKNL